MHSILSIQSKDTVIQAVEVKHPWVLGMFDSVAVSESEQIFKHRATDVRLLDVETVRSVIARNSADSLMCASGMKICKRWQQ